jgi:hypothetical protein
MHTYYKYIRTRGPTQWMPQKQHLQKIYIFSKEILEFSWSRIFYMAWHFPPVKYLPSFLHTCMTWSRECVSIHSNPPNFWMHLRGQQRSSEFHSPDRRFLNQLTKVSDYKQAAKLTVRQLASKTGHGFPGTEVNAEPSQHWENTPLGSQNQHTVGKSLASSVDWPSL